MFTIPAEQIPNRIREIAERAGLEGDFKGHGGRVGMVDRMDDENAPTDVTMRADRWTTPPRMVVEYGARKNSAAMLKFQPETEVEMWKPAETDEDGKTEN